MSSRSAQIEPAFLVQVLENVREGVLIADPTDQIRYGNACAWEHMRCKGPGALASTIPNLFGEFAETYELGEWRTVWRDVKHGRIDRATVHLTSTNSSHPHLTIEMVSLPDGIGETGWVALIIRDVSEERELARMKNELLSTVTHELRTPLTSLVGFTELMLARPVSEADRQAYLAQMLQDGRRLTALINNFLELQHMDRGGPLVRPMRLDLREYLTRSHLSELYVGSHELVLHLEPDLPAVIADGEALNAILGNLLTNAVKYSPAAGQIRVAARRAGSKVEIAIADDGVGLSTDVRSKLFERFFRAETSDRRKTQGAGLGLAVTRHLVEALNGRIWAESPGPGFGSTFYFTLPAIDEPEAASGATSAARPSTIAPNDFVQRIR